MKKWVIVIVFLLLIIAGVLFYRYNSKPTIESVDWLKKQAIVKWNGKTITIKHDGTATELGDYDAIFIDQDVFCLRKKGVIVEQLTNTSVIRPANVIKSM